ncbi:YmfQ family protein [Paenibacillus alkalitolerans]|uniref:YmfQ family protein n=1 Tax=Paenibacillus alkalitolerans TaxID=2799335 RepID=UPI0018F663B1|nr:YmfQ family protein [Paenibacillus alkalitolerans]
MTELTSPRGQTMLTYLPRYYEASRVMRSLLQAEGAEVDKIRQALNETLDQFFARTATWGLNDWEEELGLAPATDQPDSERRDRIVSRIRGTGTATIRVVKDVAESYDNGEIDVIEDYAAYIVTVRFVDTTGIPPNLEDLKAAVRAVLPAHLALEYEFNYFIYDELDAKNWTWDQVDSFAYTWDQWEVLN